MRCVFAYCLSYFCLAGEKSPCENPPKSQFGGFSRGDLSPRHAKIRHIYKWRVFAFHLSCLRLAGEVCHMKTHHALMMGFHMAKSRHAKRQKSHHLAGFRVAPFHVFTLLTRLYNLYLHVWNKLYVRSEKGSYRVLNSTNKTKTLHFGSAAISS